MSATLLDLYHKHVAAVYDRQMRFNDFLETNGDGGEWGYNVPSASLTFGKAIRFEAQLLGSFSEADASWLWAWANRNLNLPASNRMIADAVRDLGQKLALEIIGSNKMIPCRDVLPEELIDSASHVFGVVVTGELGYDAYYTIPYHGGRAAAVIQDQRLQVSEPYPLLRISSIFTQAISGYPILDHRRAFVAYVESYGLETKATGTMISVLSAGAEVMAAEFDQEDRLAKLETTVLPRQQS